MTQQCQQHRWVKLSGVIVDTADSVKINFVYDLEPCLNSVTEPAELKLSGIVDTAESKLSCAIDAAESAKSPLSQL